MMTGEEKEMRYTVPHYYSRFACVAGACPDTCCAGWAIMIDEKSLQRYRRRRDSFGNRLHNSIDWKEGSFKQYDGRCAFLNDENLCDIYSEAGPFALCKTCRSYPRHIEEFEGEREISLSLSCPVAAELILGCSEKVHFLSREDEKEESYEDFDFFLYTKLADTRELVLSFLQDRELEFQFRMGMALGLIHDLQRRIAGDRLYEVDELLKRYGKMGARDSLGAKLSVYQVGTADRYCGMRELFDLLKELEVLKADWTVYLDMLEEALYGAGREEYEEKRQLFFEYLEADEKRMELWELWGEQLMVYFVFTYFCGAVYDGHALGKMKLAVVSTLVIREMAQALWQIDGELKPEAFKEAARRYSREVEHSDLNLNHLEKRFHEKGACSFSCLMELVMG